MASIAGLAIMSDWQAIKHDPCLDYSLYHNPELTKNLSASLELDSQYSLSSTCWNKSNSHDLFKGMTNVEITNGHLDLYYNFLMYNSQNVLNCRLHTSTSTSTCYTCKNSSADASLVEMHLETTGNEICYSSSAKYTPEEPDSLKLSIVCDGDKDKSHCMSACFHLHHDSQETAMIQEIQKQDTQQLIGHAYKNSLLLVQDLIYNAARNKCASMTDDRCHWIPDSLVTHKTCKDCQPICRSLSRTMSFIQFVAGSIWFMLTYPVAEVALPIVISDSIQKDYQVCRYWYVYMCIGDPWMHA